MTKKTPKMTIQEMREFGVTAAAIARKVGVFPVYIYAFLAPHKYPRIRLSGEAIRRIAKLEGRPTDIVMSEYRARLEQKETA